MLKRKLELAYRIDCCSSQILAFALTVVKTILMMATQFGGVCMEVLQRSLKIGFLIALESMVSTQGAELGMIEDLECASAWLSLVTLRLVTIPDVQYNRNNNLHDNTAAAVAAESLHSLDDGWSQGLTQTQSDSERPRSQRKKAGTSSRGSVVSSSCAVGKSENVTIRRDVVRLKV
jgi:hypothetical protein